MLTIGNTLSIRQLVRIAQAADKVQLDDERRAALVNSRRLVEEKLAAREIIYGVDTGFGELAHVSITAEQTRALQLNLVRSHAVGVGEPLASEVVRAMMLLRIHSLAQGYSGVRHEVLDVLVAMLNSNVLPVVPCKGSLGASGDLVPLAHIALAACGEGEVSYQGERREAGQVLNELGIAPLELEAKEGLALINGTQLMTALGAIGVHGAKRLVEHADMAAAFSTDVLKGSMNHTDPRIHRLRPHKGQICSAANIRAWMSDSEVWASHQGCSKVQDAYSLRCAPQVHGAVRDAISYAEQVIKVEMNSVTDNPLIFAEDEEILSGGNFHGEPLAFALDLLGIALAELANISERRTARLVDHKLSECLPPFLTRNSGLNSGFMVAQYTAAALASENKVLAHPASVDSIPTSANQEDHVSMGAVAGQHAMTILENSRRVLAIELMCAAQALDLLRPLRSSPMLETVHERIRQIIPVLSEDRPLDKDVAKLTEMLAGGELIKGVG
jgi:histidine ammonia-lyase